MAPNEWYVIGRGLAGWHALGLKVSSSGGDLDDRPWWAGGIQAGYLSGAVEGCLVYDAAEADREAFTHLVLSGPMCDPELAPGTVNRFTDQTTAARMAPWLGGAFQQIAAAAQDPEYGGLDYVAVDVYRTLLAKVPGIKLGTVRAGVVVWE